jgi:uncharacterized protein (TIGR02594 family)
MLTTLRLGDQGDDVKKLQKLLNRKLLPPSHLKEDGEFGPSTFKAVKRFQLSVGQTNNGVVGLRTWARLYGTFKIVLPKVSSPPWMTWLQNLKNLFSANPTPWMDKDKGEVGTTRKKGPENNPKILEYFKATSYHSTTDEEAWCSAFANWVMKEAGYRGTNSAWALDWKKWKWGKKLEEPRYGAITVVYRPPKGKMREVRHVSFFVSQSPTHFHLLGGNQTLRKYDDKGREIKELRVNSTVTESKYPKGGGYEFSFYWPTEEGKIK